MRNLIFISLLLLGCGKDEDTAPCIKKAYKDFTTSRSPKRV